jgi:hypothetical protein
MNPAYGVCVTGSGGMLPVTTSVVTPSSEGIETALAQEVAAAEAVPTTVTDPQAERQVQIDARRSKKSSRRTTRKSNNDTQRTRKNSRRDSRRLNVAPQIELQFFQEVPPVVPFEEVEDAEDPEELDGPITAEAEEVDEGKPEIVRIRNLDDVSVVLSRIESIGQPDVFSTLSVTIPAGGTYLLESGQYVPNTAPSNTTIWTKETVCPAGGGVHVVAAQSGSSQTHTFTVHCGELVSNGIASAGNTRKRKKKKQQQKKQQANRRDAKQKRQDRKKSGRGKRR